MTQARDYTQRLFLASRAICSPLEALFTLLIFIVSKELNASALQLTLLACAKPVVSLLAFNATALIVGKPQRIRHFLIAASLIGSLPCLLFPIVQNVWYFIVSYALFMTALRASYPAWIEILKNNLGLQKIGNVVAKGSSFNYFLLIFVPLLFADLVDQKTQIWKILFFFVALFQLFNIAVLFQLKWKPSLYKSEKDPFISQSRLLIISWKEGWKQFKENRYFANYQLLFFLGGAGVVAVQPILPIYFKETLHLSYTQLTLAFSLCKGVSFVLSSPFWVSWVKRHSLYALNGVVNLLSTLFIGFILLASEGDLNWLFLAYFMYGTMQSGCELSWNLSGPIFSKDKESTLFSSFNLIFVGLRGCICPFIGQLVFAYSNALGVFIFAGIVCLISSIYAIWLEHSHKKSQTNLIVTGVDV